LSHIRIASPPEGNVHCLRWSFHPSCHLSL
jgi:hypothetical protein